jgi:hypothetical protein
MMICLGELLYGSSLTLLTAASSHAGSPALCLDKPIMGKAQYDGDQVYTHMYNHVHDAALLQIILKEQAGAGGMRVLKDAPAPGAGTAHLIAKLVSYLQAMMDKDTESAYTELAYGVNSDSD